MSVLKQVCFNQLQHMIPRKYRIVSSLFANVSRESTHALIRETRYDEARVNVVIIKLMIQ